MKALTKQLGVIWIGASVAMDCLASSVDARRTSPPISVSIQPLGNALRLRGGASNFFTNRKSLKGSASPESASERLRVVQSLRQRKSVLAVCITVLIASVAYSSDTSAGSEIINSIGSALTTTRAKLLVLMVFQNACTVLLGRYTRSSSTAAPEDMYVINHLVLMCEIVKGILSCILEYRATGGHLWQSIEDNIIKQPMNSVKIVIPSLLYLVQNSLQYVALSNLSAPLFQVTYQTKLLTTALASVLLLQRRYTPKQWVCLLTLGIGVAIVVLGESAATQSKSSQTTKERTPKMPSEDEAQHKQHLVVGLSAVIVACLSSAMASVYLEKVLKKPASVDAAGSKPVSLWMFNLQMAFFSASIAAIQTKNLTGEDAKKPFLHGFTPWVWALVFLQAGGGLLVAAVMKYADNVLKGLATGVSVVVSTSLSMALFGTPLTRQFSAGAFLILASVYYFSQP